MDCECCENTHAAEQFGFWRQAGAAEIVMVAGHRRHALCHRCNNAIMDSLEATTWWLTEWAEWRAMETNASRDRGREAVPGDFTALIAKRAKLYGYYMAALDGRRAALRSPLKVVEGDHTLASADAATITLNVAADKIAEAAKAYERPTPPGGPA